MSVTQRGSQLVGVQDVSVCPASTPASGKTPQFSLGDPLPHSQPIYCASADSRTEHNNKCDCQRVPRPWPRDGRVAHAQSVLGAHPLPGSEAVRDLRRGQCPELQSELLHPTGPAALCIPETEGNGFSLWLKPVRGAFSLSIIFIFLLLATKRILLTQLPPWKPPTAPLCPQKGAGNSGPRPPPPHFVAWTVALSCPSLRPPNTDCCSPNPPWGLDPQQPPPHP